MNGIRTRSSFPATVRSITEHLTGSPEQARMKNPTRLRLINRFMWLSVYLSVKTDWAKRPIKKLNWKITIQNFLSNIL